MLPSINRSDKAIVGIHNALGLCTANMLMVDFFTSQQYMLPLNAYLIGGVVSHECEWYYEKNINCVFRTKIISLTSIKTKDYFPLNTNINNIIPVIGTTDIKLIHNGVLPLDENDINKYVEDYCNIKEINKYWIDEENDLNPIECADGFYEPPHFKKTIRFTFIKNEYHETINV